jgi:hypothetical protein
MKLNYIAILQESKAHSFADHLESTDDATKAATVKAISIAQFPALYKSTVRPILLAVVGFLRLFRRGDAANALAQAVAFIDLVVDAGLPGLPAQP